MTIITITKGNKRKLSVSMALIGGSDILYLDEPSRFFIFEFNFCNKKI